MALPTTSDSITVTTDSSTPETVNAALPTEFLSQQPVATPSMTNNLSDGSMVGALPIRAEKRIIPSSVSVPDVQAIFQQGVESTGDNRGLGFVASDFYVTGAKKDLTDYVKIRIPHRGINIVTHEAAPDADAEFKFLINPKTVSISKQTVDGQAFTRGGWQFGVWGEDISQIRLSGQTAGSYFALGLTDEHQYYARSYRNLLQLQQVFENNGYWFEGEEYNEGPMAADYLRRRIRMHQDLELWVGNFIWSGMFESMTISQKAENPFQIDFDLTFLAWKERYRSSSGYWNSFPNNVQRGHSYSAVEASTAKTASDVVLAQSTAIANVMKTSQISSDLSSNPNANSPAVMAAAAEELQPTTDSQLRTTMGPISNLLMPPSSQEIWNLS